MVKINKDTQLYISIAERPGNLGSLIFNTLFEKMSLNAIYKPLLVRAEDLVGAIKGIRAFNIRGCGVSMPHKIKVISCLDEINATADRVGAVNTIVNDGGFLKGYNTDFQAVKMLTKTVDRKIKESNVLIVGAGGEARAVIGALEENGFRNIFIANRNNHKSKVLSRKFSIKYISWNDKDTLSGGLLVNATPVGMGIDDTCVFPDKTINNFRAVMDVVVSPTDTYLIKKAKKFGKLILPGVNLASIQGWMQFKLYTGMEIPVKMVEENINKFFTM